MDRAAHVQTEKSEWETEVEKQLRRICREARVSRSGVDGGDAGRRPT